MWSDNFHEPEVGCDAPEEIETAETRGGEAEAESHVDDAYAHDITQRYFEDIGRLRILNANEEQDYARRMKRGAMTTAHVMRSGDRTGGGHSVDLAGKEV